ncbi:MAG: DoxX family protein [Phototrophicaceae bacterium]
MSTFNTLLRRLPYLLAAVAAYVVIDPALQKFTNHSVMVGFFDSLGFPIPEVTVVFVGVIELLAVAAFVFGIAGRWMALVLGSEMVVAMLTAGVNTNNTVVLICCIGIALLGTGERSLWQPKLPILNGEIGEASTSPAQSRR